MLINRADTQRQYRSFLQALDEIRDIHAVRLMDFRAMLSDLPDQIVERLFFSHRGITSTSPLFNETRDCVEKEYRSRDISATKHRIWRICRDVTPPILTRTFGTAIQSLAGNLRVGPYAS